MILSRGRFFNFFSAYALFSCSSNFKNRCFESPESRAAFNNSRYNSGWRFLNRWIASWPIVWTTAWSPCTFRYTVSGVFLFTKPLSCLSARKKITRLNPATSEATAVKSSRSGKSSVTISASGSNFSRMCASPASAPSRLIPLSSWKVFDAVSGENRTIKWAFPAISMAPLLTSSEASDISPKPNTARPSALADRRYSFRASISMPLRS